MADKVHAGIDRERVRNAVDLFLIANKMPIVADGSKVLFNDTDINALSTGVAGLKALVSDAQKNNKLHSTDLQITRSLLEAIAEMTKLELLTDSNINGLSTGFAGLLALISGEDYSVDDSTKPRGIYTYTGNVIRGETQIP